LFTQIIDVDIPQHDASTVMHLLRWHKLTSGRVIRGIQVWVIFVVWLTTVTAFETEHLHCSNQHNPPLRFQCRSMRIPTWWLQISCMCWQIPITSDCSKKKVVLLCRRFCAHRCSTEGKLQCA